METINGRPTSALSNMIEAAKTDVWSHWTTFKICTTRNVRTVQFGPAEPFFPSYALSLLERNTRNMTYINSLIPKLRKAPQPPLSYPGATSDSDRAKKPSLADPPATDQELNPGDRVEGLGDFGKPTGEFGTVEQSNEDDAVVKWDDDGRMRLHQPSLKKV